MSRKLVLSRLYYQRGIALSFADWRHKKKVKKMTTTNKNTKNSELKQVYF